MIRPFEVLVRVSVIIEDSYSINILFYSIIAYNCGLMDKSVNQKKQQFSDQFNLNYGFFDNTNFKVPSVPLVPCIGQDK